MAHEAEEGHVAAAELVWRKEGGTKEGAVSRGGKCSLLLICRSGVPLETHFLWWWVLPERKRITLPGEVMTSRKRGGFKGVISAPLEIRLWMIWSLDLYLWRNTELWCRKKIWRNVLIWRKYLCECISQIPFVVEETEDLDRNES